jgi:hypothetical protein
MRELDRSRRSFLKASAIAGLSRCIIAPLGSRAFAALFEDKILTPIQWDTAKRQREVSYRRYREGHRREGVRARRARGRHAALAEPAIARIHSAHHAG